MKDSRPSITRKAQGGHHRPTLAASFLRCALPLLLLASTALACKVPVFRFALERWETDDYTIVSRSPSVAGEQENLTTRTDPNLPTEFAAYYPESSGIETPFWTGDDDAGVHGSPLRDALVAKILAGASTIWILVEGPDPEENDATERRLTQLLAAAAKSVEIPEGVVRPEQLDTGEVNLADIDIKDVLRSPIPLKIGLETLRLKHGDQGEAFFHSMLLGTHPELLARNREEPILVPVFGRGRMLEGLPASRLNGETVTMATEYLCGECSCEVKDENPGVDLLLDVSWDKALENSYTIIDQQLPPLAGTGEFTAQDSAAAQVPAPPAQAATPTGSTLARNLFIIAIACISILALASARFWRPGA